MKLNYYFIKKNSHKEDNSSVLFERIIYLLFRYFSRWISRSTIISNKLPYTKGQALCNYRLRYIRSKLQDQKIFFLRNLTVIVILKCIVVHFILKNITVYMILRSMAVDCFIVFCLRRLLGFFGEGCGCVWSCQENHCVC